MNLKKKNKLIPKKDDATAQSAGTTQLLSFIFFAHGSFWKSWLLLLVLSFIVSAAVWFPKYSLLPSGLNRDEAALGYNAYSIALTGRDEWGKQLPISITSFGDQKLPGYVYTLVPFIMTFGLEEWVVRLPSLLAGFVVVGGMGLIAVQFSRQVGFDKRFVLLSSLVTMLLTAISPWHLHFSRVAYESHLAMAFYVVAIASTLFAMNTQSARQRWLLILAALGFCLSILTYHSYQILTPLTVVLLSWIYKKQLPTVDRIGVGVGVLIAVVTAAMLFFGGVVGANLVKSRGISPFNEQTLLEQVTAYRQASPLPSIFDKLLFNKYSQFVVVFTQQYIQTISGQFFWVQGSNHGDHNPGNGNQIDLILFPFTLLGMLFMVQQRRNSTAVALMGWLLLALLPPALTITPLHEVRIAAVFPMINFIAALGIVTTILYLKTRGVYTSILSAALVLLLMISCYRTFLFYTSIAPLNAVDNKHYHQLGQLLSKYQSTEMIVLTQSPSSSPYIWYLFENKIDPTHAQQRLVHYPPTEEGFIHVRSIDNILFETIDWNDIARRTLSYPMILILKPTEISDQQKAEPTYQLLETVTDDQGEILYEVWKVGLTNALSA